MPGSDLLASGLLHKKLAAGAANDVEPRTGFDKLEAIAEGVSLPHQGENLRIAQGQGELQANHFARWNLHAQHGGNPRFADVHRLPPNHRGVTRVDADVDFQLEPGIAASVHKSRESASLNLNTIFDGLP